MKGVKQEQKSSKSRIVKQPTSTPLSRRQSLKKLALALVIVLVAAGMYFAVADRTHDAKQRAELERKTQLLESTRDKLEEHKALTNEQVKKLEQLNEELEKTKRELEAKRKTQVAYAATKPKPVVKSYTGTKYDWMRQAGIPQDQWAAVDFIVTRESSWNPNARGPVTNVMHNGVLLTGQRACGLAQALPCVKVGANWNNPVVSLKWQYQYVQARYGGYWGAYNFWKVNHWY